jgi:hypothetical protein
LSFLFHRPVHFFDKNKSVPYVQNAVYICPLIWSSNNQVVYHFVILVHFRKNVIVWNLNGYFGRLFYYPKPFMLRNIMLHQFERTKTNFPSGWKMDGWHNSIIDFIDDDQITLEYYNLIIPVVLVYFILLPDSCCFLR